MARYRTVRLESGDYNIYDVPVFGEVPEGVKMAPFNIDRRWMSSALAEARRLEREQHYLPPLHVEHHMTGNPVEHAGYFRLRRIVRMSVEGQQMAVLTADFLHVPAETFERLQAGRLPYRSVEVIDWESPHINSLALLSTDEPFFRFPLLRKETMSVVEEGEKPSVLAHSRGSGALVLFSMGDLMEQTGSQSAQMSAFDQVMEDLDLSKATFDDVREAYRAFFERTLRSDEDDEEEDEDDPEASEDGASEPSGDSPIEMQDDEEEPSPEGGETSPIEEILGEEPEGVPAAEDGAMPDAVTDPTEPGDPAPEMAPDAGAEPEPAPAADPTVSLEALAIQLKTLAQDVANIRAKIDADERHGDPAPAEMTKSNAENAANRDSVKKLMREKLLNKRVDAAIKELNAAHFHISDETRAEMVRVAENGADQLDAFVQTYKRVAVPDPQPIDAGKPRSGKGSNVPVSDPDLVKFANRGPEVFERAIALKRDWEQAKRQYGTQASLEDFIEINLEAEESARQEA